MSGDLAISVENVSKAYRIWNDPAARLKAPLIGAAAGVFPRGSAPHRTLAAKETSYYRDFFALKDVSFEVRKGESMGIMGRNGSGKSTLLQIIAGTLQPTGGSVRVNGRVAALLELGSGFNPDFTGRENVYLNAAVLGLTRAETEARFDQIAAFADIGEFLEQPAKTYSSGMMMRLAFAVQTAVDPEILIVDEALSVGDAPFQARCFARIRALLDRGVSVLFVSHDLGSIRSFCTTALYLHSGETVSHGAAKTVCDRYQIDCMRQIGLLGETAAPATTPHVNRTRVPANPEFARRALTKRSGTGGIQMIDAQLLDLNQRPVDSVRFDEDVVIDIVAEARRSVAGELVIGVCAKSLSGVEVLEGTDKRGEHPISLAPTGQVRARIGFRFPLKAGDYYLTIAFFCFPIGKKMATGVIDFAQAELLDIVETALFFRVECYTPWAHYGPVFWQPTCEVEAVG